MSESEKKQLSAYYEIWKANRTAQQMFHYIFEENGYTCKQVGNISTDSLPATNSLVSFCLISVYQWVQIPSLEPSHGCVLREDSHFRCHFIKTLVLKSKLKM